MGLAGASWCAVLLAWCVTLSAIDLRHRRLPNALTLTGAAVIIAVASATGRGQSAALGALALGGIYALVHLAAPAGLGAGDVKLAVGLGALTASLGVGAWLLAALAAPVMTAVAGACSALRRRGGAVPHGPAMCAASLAAALLAVL